MSTNRNLGANYPGAQDMYPSGASQSNSRFRDSTTSSSFEPRFPVSQSRQDRTSTNRQDYVLPTRQDYMPPTRRDYMPSTSQDCAPRTGTDYIPPTRQDYFPPARQDYVSPTRQNYVSPLRKDYEPPTRQDYVPPTRQDNEPLTRQDYVPPSRQDNLPSSRYDYVSPSRQGREIPTRQDYIPATRKDYGPQSIQDYSSQSGRDQGPNSTQSYSSQNRQDYIPQSQLDDDSQNRREYGSFNRRDFRLQKREDSTLQIRQDYGPQSRRDYSPQNREDSTLQIRQDYGPQSRRDYSPQNREDSSLQIRQDYGPQSRRDYVPQGSRDFRPQIEKDFRTPHNQNLSFKRSDYDPQSRQDNSGEKGNNIPSDGGNKSRIFLPQGNTTPSFLTSVKVKPLIHPSKFNNYGQNFDGIKEPINVNSSQKFESTQNYRNSGPSNSVQFSQNPSTSQSSYNTSILKNSSDNSIKYDKTSSQKDDDKRKGIDTFTSTRPDNNKTYCKYCKMVISGKQQYESHIKSQRHAMKEQLALEKATVPREPLRSGDLMCPLCEVYCQDAFSYRSHVRGSKHKQVVKLHKKLGKPIPICNVETVKAEARKRAVPVATEYIEKIENSLDAGKVLCKLCNCQLSDYEIDSHCKGRRHRINYIKKVKNDNENEPSKPDENDTGPFDVDDPLFWEEKDNEKRELTENSQHSQDHDEGQFKQKESAENPDNPIRCEVCNITCGNAYAYSTHLRGGRHRKELSYQRRFGGIRISKQESKAAKREAMEKIPCIGEEYIVEGLPNSEGKSEVHPNVLYCKLCECQLDIKSKDKHLKGKRHREAYNKKVDPSLPIESMHERGVSWREFLEQKKEEQRKSQESTTNQVVEATSVNVEEEDLVDAEDVEFQKSEVINLPTYADRHITLKDESIYPDKTELENIDQSVSECETILKNAYTKIFEDEMKNDDEDSVQNSPNQRIGQEVRKYNVVYDNFVIKAVVRTGIFAKNLMLKGDNTIYLVVLCEEIPTLLLLNNFYSEFCKEFKVISREKHYTSKLIAKDAAIVVSTKSETNININMIFTSTNLAENIASYKEKLTSHEIDYCGKPFDALIQLRRTRWFKAKLEDNYNNIVVLRVLRAMCNENPAWSPLNCWVLELLVHKVMYEAEDLSTAGIMRKFLEGVSAGILLPDSCGINDPCEKEQTDAAGYLTIQQRVDITTSAQFYLRRMAFNLIDSVLHTVIPPEESEFIPSETFTNENVKRRFEDNEMQGSKKLKAM